MKMKLIFRSVFLVCILAGAHATYVFRSVPTISSAIGNAKAWRSISLDTPKSKPYLINANKEESVTIPTTASCEEQVQLGAKIPTSFQDHRKGWNFTYHSKYSIAVQCYPILPSDRITQVLSGKISCSTFYGEAEIGDLNWYDRTWRGELSLREDSSSQSPNTAIQVQPTTGHAITWFDAKPLKMKVGGIDRETTTDVDIFVGSVVENPSGSDLCDEARAASSPCLMAPSTPLKIWYDTQYLVNHPQMHKFCALSPAVMSSEVLCAAGIDPSNKRFIPSWYDVRLNGQTDSNRHNGAEIGPYLVGLLPTDWPIELTCRWCKDRNPEGTCVEGHPTTIDLTTVPDFETTSTDQMLDTIRVMNGSKLELRCLAKASIKSESFTNVQWYFKPLEEQSSSITLNQIASGQTRSLAVVSLANTGVHSCVARETPDSDSWIQGNFAVEVYQQPSCVPFGVTEIAFETWKDSQFTSYWRCSFYHQWSSTLNGQNMEIHYPPALFSAELRSTVSFTAITAPECGNEEGSLDETCYTLIVTPIQQTANGDNVEDLWNNYPGQYGISLKFETPTFSTPQNEIKYVVIKDPFGVTSSPLGPAASTAPFPWWWIAIAAGVLLLVLLILVILYYLRQNDGKTYNVDKKERKAGHDPEKEIQAADFPEFVPLMESDANGMSPRTSLPVSETDSLHAYGDIDMGKFNEDGSFIGAYRGNQNNHTTDV